MKISILSLPSISISLKLHGCEEFTEIERVKDYKCNEFTFSANAEQYVFLRIQDMGVTGSVSHDRREETPEAKARWFMSLSISDRMDLLCEFTDIALSINPQLPELKNAQPSAKRIQVISRA